MFSSAPNKSRNPLELSSLIHSLIPYLQGQLRNVTHRHLYTSNLAKLHVAFVRNVLSSSKALLSPPYAWLFQSKRRLRVYCLQPKPRADGAVNRSARSNELSPAPLRCESCEGPRTKGPGGPAAASGQPPGLIRVAPRLIRALLCGTRPDASRTLLVSAYGEGERIAFCRRMSKRPHCPAARRRDRASAL